MRRAAPSTAAPVSSDVVEIVKRKITAPSMPPPDSLKNFSAPKRFQDDDDDWDEDEDFFEPNYNDYDDGYRRERTRGDSIDGYGTKRQGNDSRDKYDRGQDLRDDYSEDDSYDRRDRYEDEEDDSVGDRNNWSTSVPARRIQQVEPPIQKGRYIDQEEQSPRAHPKSNKYSGSSMAESKKEEKKGDKVDVFDFGPILKATYRELRAFVTLPARPGVVVRCYIERNRSGSNMLTPFYSLCADLDDGTGREIMVCKKIFQSMSAHYVFSLKMEDLSRKRQKRSKLYLGKLRGVSASEYVLYDHGVIEVGSGHGAEDMEDDDEEENIGKAAAAVATVDDTGESLYRRELAAMVYNSKTRPIAAGTRGLEICIPKPVPCNELPLEATNAPGPAVAKGKYPISVLDQFQKIKMAGKQNEMMSKSHYVMHERKSRYDPLSSCLVDFRGRANIASVKNFQLVESTPMHRFDDTEKVSQSHPKNDYVFGSAESGEDDEEASRFILQLGKTTEDCFNMDFKYPLSMLQAFAICIARFDANLKW